jgi:hypothetical protein
MREVEINAEIVAELGSKLERCIDRYGEKHPDMKIQDALSALMHVIAYFVGTTACPGCREDLVANVMHFLPDMLDRTLARAAEMEPDADGAAEPAGHLH